MTLWATDCRVRSAQDLEDLATASWLSETLFAALSLELFAHLGEHDLPTADLAARCGADEAAFARLLAVLQVLGLVSLHEGHVAATAVARRHLLAGVDGYLGHSLAYRRRLAGVWPGLATAVRQGGSTVRPSPAETDAEYRQRVRDYLLAMDDVARHKAGLIVERVETEGLPPSVLDLAGGAGGIAAAFLERMSAGHGTVVDLPDVVREAEALWDERGAVQNATPADMGDRGPRGGTAASDPPPSRPVRPRFLGLDLLADRLPSAPGDGAGWGLIVASNIVHAYGATESAALLQAAAEALHPRGLLLIHDFWTDGPGRGPAKSGLFDLHMLLNTYEGRTYPWTWARDLLQGYGLSTRELVPLGGHPGDEDTALIAAAWDPAELRRIRHTPLERLDTAARELGFARTATLAPSEVVTAEWVQEKCRHGCSGYARGGQCPPRAPAVRETYEILGTYAAALLVEGEPPGRDFHRRMLALERKAFLSGHYRALAFVAGPCRLCPECAPDDCRDPGGARPSMEASGIDVYRTAAAAGWDLRPVTDARDPVAYLGLLLVD